MTDIIKNCHKITPIEERPIVTYSLITLCRDV